MNLHIHTHVSHTHRAVARPLSRIGPGGQYFLDEVVVENFDGGGHEAIHLSPDQTLAVQAQLSQLAAVFLHGAFPTGQVNNGPMSAVSEPTVMLIVKPDGNGSSVLERVVIEDGNGRAAVNLGADQVRDIEQQLTTIAVDYLHENAWGGENARTQ